MAEYLCNDCKNVGEVTHKSLGFFRKNIITFIIFILGAIATKEISWYFIIVTFILIAINFLYREKICDRCGSNNLKKLDKNW